MSKNTWSPKFGPTYTPLEMLEKGVFEGKYINIITGLPKTWYSLSKVKKKDEEPDPSVNYYGVKSRQPLSVWKENKWIKTDKGGWFHWYCLYYLGRRLGEEDDWQIGRWRSFVARHSAQVTKKCNKGDKSCNTKQRQALLQWGWDSDMSFNDEQVEINIKKLSKNPTVSLEAQETPFYTQW